MPQPKTAAAADASRGFAVLESASGNPGGDTMNGKFALVVDDSRSARFAMRRFLERCGHEVETADSGHEALDKLRQRKPDVIFLDHMMPVMDGFDVLDRLHGEASAAPVVLCSSNETPDFLQLARAHGASEILIKPPTAEQLAAVLSRLQQTGAAARLFDAEPAPAALVDGEPVTPVEPMPVAEPDAPSGVAAFDPGTLPVSHPVSSRQAPTLQALALPAEDLAAPAASRIREQIEHRLEQLTRELVAQIGGLRTEVAQLEAGGSLARIGIDERHESLQRSQQELEARIERVAAHFDGLLDALRRDIDIQFEIQAQRLERVLGEARDAAAVEAQSVAAQVVADAARRISAQIAESVRGALGSAAGVEPAR